MKQINEIQDSSSGVFIPKSINDNGSRLIQVLKWDDQSRNVSFPQSSNWCINARFQEREGFLLALFSSDSSIAIETIVVSRALPKRVNIAAILLPLFTRSNPSSLPFSLYLSELCVNYLSKIGGVERRVKRCTRPTEPTESDTRQRVYPNFPSRISSTNNSDVSFYFSSTLPHDYISLIFFILPFFLRYSSIVRRSRFARFQRNIRPCSREDKRCSRDNASRFERQKEIEGRGE